MILQLKIPIFPTKINYKVSDPRFGTLHVLYLILKEFKVLLDYALKIETNSLKYFQCLSSLLMLSSIFTMFLTS